MLSAWSAADATDAGNANVENGDARGFELLPEDGEEYTSASPDAIATARAASERGAQQGVSHRPKHVSWLVAETSLRLITCQPGQFEITCELKGPWYLGTAR